MNGQLPTPIHLIYTSINGSVFYPWGDYGLSTRQPSNKPPERLVDFNRLLNLFQMLDPDMPTQTVRTYVLVALAHPEAVLMSSLAQQLGIAQSSVSRNVAALSDWTRHHREGLDLIEARENPLDRRQKLVSLTSKGQKLLEQFS